MTDVMLWGYVVWEWEWAAAKVFRFWWKFYVIDLLSLFSGLHSLTFISRCSDHRLSGSPGILASCQYGNWNHAHCLSMYVLLF